jgi:hypothetical protein
VGIWLNNIPILMGAIILLPADWALSGAMYHALLVQQERRITKRSRVPVMAMAVAALIFLVGGGVLSVVVLAMPALVWWRSRNDHLRIKPNETQSGRIRLS